jgi:creatinine amidohydrolase/Fe(II)-dependent formamide hydrolase-like protein
MRTRERGRASWFRVWVAAPLAMWGMAAGVLAPAAARDSSDAGEGPAPRCWRYERMRPADLAEAVKERPIAWLVVSPLEWHGEALSFGCDPQVAQTVADLAWEKTGGVRLPTMYLGVEIDYLVWEGNERVDYWGMELGTRERNPGSVYVRPLTLELVLRDYLYFLQREGFKLCVIVSGHGTEDHLAVIRDVCSKYDKAPMRAVMWYAWGAGEPPAELRFDGAGQHADFDEVSVLGGADPTLVDRSRFGVIERDRKVKILRENAGKIDFVKGRRIIEFRAAQLEKHVKALVKELNLGSP